MQPWFYRLCLLKSYLTHSTMFVRRSHLVLSLILLLSSRVLCTEKLLVENIDKDPSVIGNAKTKGGKADDKWWSKEKYVYDAPTETKPWKTRMRYVNAGSAGTRLRGAQEQYADEEPVRNKLTKTNERFVDEDSKSWMSKDSFVDEESSDGGLGRTQVKFANGAETGQWRSQVKYADEENSAERKATVKFADGADVKQRKVIEKCGKYKPQKADLKNIQETYEKYKKEQRGSRLWKPKETYAKDEPTASWNTKEKYDVKESTPGRFSNIAKDSSVINLVEESTGVHGGARRIEIRVT